MVSILFTQVLGDRFRKFAFRAPPKWFVSAVLAPSLPPPPIQPHLLASQRSLRRPASRYAASVMASAVERRVRRSRWFSPSVMPCERMRLWVALMRCPASLRLSIASARTVSASAMSEVYGQTSSDHPIVSPSRASTPTGVC
jgi:hypothetical protein